MRFEDLPYRPCVGVMLLNRDGLVFVGRRIEGPEHVDLTHSWQMPQGGIDPGEEPWPAAAAGTARRNQYPLGRAHRRDRGMAALRHSARHRRPGLERQISRPNAKMVCDALHRRGQRNRRHHPDGAQEAEFAAWRWEPMQNVPGTRGAVQARGLRARRPRIRASREIIATAISARPRMGRSAMTRQERSCLAQSAMAPSIAACSLAALSADAGLSAGTGRDRGPAAAIAEAAREIVAQGPARWRSRSPHGKSPTAFIVVGIGTTKLLSTATIRQGTPALLPQILQNPARGLVGALLIEQEEKSALRAERQRFRRARRHVILLDIGLATGRASAECRRRPAAVRSTDRA